MSEIILSKSTTGDAVVTSKQIAEQFGKNHKDTLHAIRRTVAETPQDWSRRNFTPCEYLAKNGRKEIMYTITEEGFAILAMGFGGKKALQFKIDYINAFNRLHADNQVKAEQLSQLQQFWLSHHPSHEAVLVMHTQGFATGRIADMLGYAPSTIATRKRQLAHMGFIPKNPVPKNFLIAQQNAKENANLPPFLRNTTKGGDYAR